MSKLIDLTGQRFERLIVIGKAPSRNGKTYWHCKCDCGVEKEVYGYCLRSGQTKSCGCWSRDKTKERHFIDLTGQKFGKLTVISEDCVKNNKRYWKCKCDCGNETSVITNELRSGHTKSCGCLRHDLTNYKNITNQIFGYLIAINVVGKDKRNNAIWHCKCKCGNECNVLATQLLQGKTKSCGCLSKEKTIERNIENRQVKIGNQYGFLKVIGDAGYKKIGEHRKHQSYCTCLRCGKENVIKLDSDLLSKRVLSCGCLGSSYGEEIVKKILEENDIPYESEKTFKTCYFSDTNKLAKFDFFIDNKYIIEFDGIQHFKATGGWNTEEKVEKTKQHDKIKNQWCKENNIPLIRIPYTHLENLCLKDLQLETTSFCYS